MTEGMTTLIIGYGASDSQELVKAYSSEITFENVEYTSALHKGLEILTDSNYDLCILAESFTEDELTVFNNDYKKLEKDDYCAFVQVTDSVEQDLDRTRLQEIGIITIISHLGTYADREALKEALKDFLHKKEVKERVVNVDSALKIMLGEIDKVAANKKRGRKDSINTLSIDFIADQVDFDTEVLESYYEQLSAKSEEIKPLAAQTIKVPEAVLRKNLPNLGKDGYTGASYRVWKKLLKLHGVELEADEDSQIMAGNDTPPTNEEPQEQQEADSSSGELLTDNLDLDHLLNETIDDDKTSKKD